MFAPAFARLLLWPLLLLGFAPAAAQPLKVTLLGTGSPILSMERFGPSILVEAGPNRVLFDCGRGASQRLWQLNVPLGTVGTVFFTHLHFDHVVGFADLWLAGRMPGPFGRRTVPLRVYGPTGTQAMVAGLRQAYAWELQVRVQPALAAPGTTVEATDIGQGVVFERDGLKVTAFDVRHGDNLKPALGYRVDYAGRTVVLSGDTGFSDNLIQFAQGADLLVHEVIAAQPELLRTSETARRVVATHTQPEEAGRVFARVKPRLAVYSHIVLLALDPALPPPTAPELLPRTRTTYAGPLEIGEDLMSIEIGKEITVRRFVPPGP